MTARLCLSGTERRVNALLNEARREKQPPGLVERTARSIGIRPRSGRGLQIAADLAAIGPPAVPQLIDALGHEALQVRAVAALALGRIRDGRAFAPLVEMLQGDSGARLYAAMALGRFGDQRAVEPLLSALNDRVAAPFALHSLGHLGDPRAIPPLVEILKNPSSSHGCNPASALAQLGAVDPLLEALHDEDPTVRLHAIKGLGQTRDRRALERLKLLVDAPDDRVRRTAAEAIRKIERAQAE